MRLNPFHHSLPCGRDSVASQRSEYWAGDWLRLPSNFIRTHRSHIVNAAMVVGMQSADAGPVALLNHNEIAPISRRRAVDVRRRVLAARGSV